MVVHRVLWMLIPGTILLALVPTPVAAADGPLHKRTHIGRVKTVDPGGSRLGVEGMFHDGTYREIWVTLEPDAAVIHPDLMNPRREVPAGAIRPGDYIALECAETGKRHTARRVTITSTETEERLGRALMQRRRAAPPELRGMGGVPHPEEGLRGPDAAPWRWLR